MEIPAGDDPVFPCLVGTRLVGNRTAGRILNGGRYTVAAIGKEKVALVDDMTGDASEAVGGCCLRFVSELIGRFFI